MHIQQLTLKHFRNYHQLDLKFDHRINLIVGENAQGKTNLMEAIHVLAFTKSHRTTKEKELIQWEQDFTKLQGRIARRHQSMPLDIVISSKGKKAKLNHIEQKRLSDYIGSLNVVMFAPEDLTLVKGVPQTRRRFIDMELGQIEPRYVYHLGQYQKVLKQRNHLLKRLQHHPKQDKTMLHVLTDQLIEHATILLERRFRFLALLRKWSVPIHQDISRGLEQFEIQYSPTIEVSEDADKAKIETILLNTFQHIETKEIDRGTTLIGPHRDDLIFLVNRKNVQTFGSQGQQRTVALSLKLAEIELIYNEVGEYPVLLLDDVLSELDDYRKSHLLQTIKGKVQTFVSATSVDGIESELQDAELFHVSKGMVNT